MMTPQEKKAKRMERARIRAFLANPYDPWLKAEWARTAQMQQTASVKLDPPFDARTVKPLIPEPDMLGEALAPAELGLPVFPCHKGGKRPVGWLVPNGLKNATTDSDTIRSWWSSGDWNIGIATGSIVVIDVDPDKGGDDSMSRLVAEHGSLPKTVMSRTGGGGSHVFFQQPPGESIGCSASAVAPGVDVRGVGGYIIAPPSQHASGKRYEWFPNLHPASTPIAHMPDWLASLCRKGGASGAVRPVDYWSQLVDSKVGEGSRNDTVMRLVGHIIWTGKVSPHVALKFARLWNEAQCAPPLDDVEVLRIVDSICGRELQKRRVR